MNRLANVKTLLSISAIFLGLLHARLSGAAAFEIGCGIHDIHGLLTKNSNGMFVLRVQERSYSPFEFLILGGSFSEKLKYRDTKIFAKVYVPKTISNNNTPFAYLQKIFPGQVSKDDKWLASSQKTECGRAEYFTQAP